jgi:hypothetical protein
MFERTLKTHVKPLKKYFSSYWIRSAFYTFLQRFSLTLFGFVNFLILIRSLSKPQMGVWAFFLVVTTLFESTKSNLLKNAHIKFVGNSNREKTAIASFIFPILKQYHNHTLISNLYLQATLQGRYYSLPW